MRLVVQNILRDFENASTFISYFLDHGYKLTTIYGEALCCLNKLRLLHGYSEVVITYQPLMPLYTITDLENVNKIPNPKLFFFQTSFGCAAYSKDIL